MTYRLFIAHKKYSSWSMRPWVLMKAAGIAFSEELIAFTPGGSQPHFAAFSPTARVPCLHDGDTVVWDSLAIIEYLAERHPYVWPAEDPARSWARSASAEMHSGFPALRDECSMNGQRVIAHDRPSDALRDELVRLASLWQDGLDRFGGPWLAGPVFTAVDAFYAPVAVRVRGDALDRPGPAMRYVARQLAHESVAAWVAAGIAETLTEPEHHDDCVRGRPIRRDLAAES